MPRPDARTAWLLPALLLALGGCSRLAFVRPDLSRGEYTQTARVVEVDDGDRVSSMAIHDRLLLAQHRLQDGKLDEAEGHAEAVLELKGRAEVVVLHFGAAECRDADACLELGDAVA